MFQNAMTVEIKFDGPMMLYIIFRNMNPDTVVGLDAIKEKLEMDKLRGFNNDVHVLLTFMEADFNTLKDNGQEPKK